MSMKVQAFTDLARTMFAQSQSRLLKTEQSRHSLELSTGQTSTPIEHLKANFSVLADVTNKVALANQYLTSNRETMHLLDTSQAVVSTIDDSNHQILESVRIAMGTGVPQAAKTVEVTADLAIQNVVNALNQAVAGRHAFSGQATNQPPLIAPEELTALIDATLSGASTAGDIGIRLSAFFAPGGDFETLAYLGSTTSMDPVRISDTRSAQMAFRADDEAFRNVLEAAFLSRAGAQIPELSEEDQKQLFSAAQNHALSAKDDLVTIASQVGAVQELVQNSNAQLQAQIAASELVQNELLAVDPYETASTLEDINTRLELLYTVTARSRNLSFLEFIR